MLFRSNNIYSGFGAPQRYSQFDYSLFDVSEDELTVFTVNLHKIYYSQRASTSDPFPVPSELGEVSGFFHYMGSVTDDMSKIYFPMDTMAFLIPNYNYFDLFTADISVDVTPTPTPTPDYPSPEPDIIMVANRDQIENETGAYANPWCGAFDSQGRFIFFDQMMGSYIAVGNGTNKLVRMSPGGSTPSFTILAGQTDLEAADDRWTYYTWPMVADIDVLSDDSIVMMAQAHVGGNPHRLLRVVPGEPPQVSVIAEFTGYLTFGGIGVDRNQTPNMIYISADENILSITADQVSGTPSVWFTAPYNVDNVEVTQSGDVLYCCSEYANILSVDKDSKSTDSLLSTSFDEAFTDYASHVTFSLAPGSGDIFGVYYSYVSPLQNRYNVYKMKKESGGSYTLSDYAWEDQILSDEDIELWAYPTARFEIPPGGIAAQSDDGYAYFTCGSDYVIPPYSSDPGSGQSKRPDAKDPSPSTAQYEDALYCIIGISTENVLGARPLMWRLYE